MTPPAPTNGFVGAVDNVTRPYKWFCKSLIVLPNIFFLRCISLIAWGTSRSPQNGLYLQKMDCFLNGTPSIGALSLFFFFPSFVTFPQLTQMVLTILKIQCQSLITRAECNSGLPKKSCRTSYFGIDVLPPRSVCAQGKLTFQILAGKMIQSHPRRPCIPSYV